MTVGPELGNLLLGIEPEPKAPELTAELIEQIAQDTLQEFLGSINPAELEVAALSQLGGLEGEESVGACFLRVLKEMAGCST